MTEKFNLPACNVAYGYAMAYTIMALVFDNPVVKENFLRPLLFWYVAYGCLNMYAKNNSSIPKKQKIFCLSCMFWR